MSPKGTPKSQKTQRLSPSKQRRLEARRRARARRRWMIALGAVVLLGLGAVAFIVTRSSSEGKGSIVSEGSACLTSDSTDLASKPAVTIPESAPPATLQKCDLVVGTGAEATAGSNVQVHYVGVAWSNGKQFDASWDSGRPLDFPLGQGRVIAGWDQGVAGMKVGGRRELVIPPNLGYGERGAGSDIKPNETLVFIVDLIKVG